MTDSERDLGMLLGQVLEATKENSKSIAQIEDQIGQLREDVAGLKVVARVWGAVAGIIGGGVVTVLIIVLRAMAGVKP